MNLTIFLPISRQDRLQIMADQIATLDLASQNVDILIILDNLKIEIETTKELFERITKLKTRVYHMGTPPVGEVNMPARRERIRDVFIKAQNYMPKNTDMVFVVEDDTEIKPNTLRTLLENYVSMGEFFSIGLISGVQVGRWAMRMVGAWEADNVNDPHIMTTIPFPVDTDLNLQLVDATGFYCFITPKKLFCEAKLTYGAFGPDVFYGLELRQKGYFNFINWNVKAGHVLNSGGVLYPNKESIVVKYVKVNGRWKLIEPSKNINIKL